MKINATTREQFLNVFAQGNVAEALVINKMALKHYYILYRAVKNDESRQNTADMTLTMPMHLAEPRAKTVKTRNYRKGCH